MITTQRAYKDFSSELLRNTMDNDEELFKQAKQISYSIRLSNDLFAKIEKHLKKLQHQEYNVVSKQKWIIDAIKEKLSEEEYLAPTQLPKGKYVNIRIDERLYAKIDQQIGKMKIAKGSYSKKQWIIEALYAKLNRELEKKS